MGFFSEGRTKTTPSAFDYLMADRLKATVITKRRRIQAWNRNHWAREFRILRQEMRGSGIRIQTVVEWYEKHANEPGVPKVDSARAFHHNFGWLEGLAENEKNPNVEVTPKAESLAKHVSYLGWPKGTEDQIPKAIQITMDNYSIFRKRIQKALEKNQFQTASEVRLAKHLLDAMPIPSRFATKWIEDVFESVKDWEGWSGDLIGRAFPGNANRKQLNKYGRGLAGAFCGKPNLWDKIMEVVQ